MPRIIQPDDIAGVVDAPVSGSRRISVDDIAGPADEQQDDSRSWFSRAVDAVNAPLLPQIGAAARNFADSMGGPRLIDEKLNRYVPGLGTGLATVRNFDAGVVEGVGNLIGGLTSPAGIVTTAAGVGGERAALQGLPVLAKALRGAEATAGAAFAGRGLEQIADAKTVGEAGLGVATVAGGLLGVRGGVNGFRAAGLPEVIPPPAPKGFLRAGPGYVAGESGPAARFGESVGESIPMERGPDGSFVRGVRGEWAQREVRGYLDPVRGFVADEGGNVVPTERAGELRPQGGRIMTRSVSSGDPSGVRSVPAVPAAYAFEHTKSAKGRNTQRLQPSQFSGDPNAAPAPHVALTPQESHALNWIEADNENHTFTKHTFNEGGPGVGGNLEITPGSAGSASYQAIVGDVSGASRADVLKAIRNLREGKLTPVGDLVLGFARELAEGKRDATRAMTLPPDAGGDLAGTAYESRQASRSVASELPEQFDTAAYEPDGFSPESESGAGVFEQPREIVNPLRQALPTEGRGAGGIGAGAKGGGKLTGQRLKLESEAAGAQKLEDFLDDLYGDDRPTPGNGLYKGEDPSGFDRFSQMVDDAAENANRPGSRTISADDIAGVVEREPGQEGFISPELQARIGLGGAGALYGAATGEDTTDRIKRAALYGGAGFLAPSLLRSSPVAGSVVGGALHTTSREARGPIPAAGEIPANRRNTMPVLTEDVQAAADDLLTRYGGFESQRRGVQSVARTEALSDRIGVPTGEPLKAGTALNAERMRAYQNATATILQKQKTLEAAVQDGTASAAQRLELEHTRNEARVLTQSFRGAAAEAGRTLHVLRYQARILASGDPELMREATAATQRGLKGDALAYFYANILSGIPTHERNILGNLSNAVYNLAAHPFAVGADAVRSKATGQARQVFIGELPERVAGTVAALPRAFSSALEVLKTGISRGEVTAMDNVAPHHEFRGGGANPFNWPGRALNSVDELFATVAGQQSLYAAAFAQAKSQGLRGQQLIDAASHYKAHPTESMLTEVKGQRARLLFREEPGYVAQAVLAAKRHVPALGYVVPFVRVPANIIRQGFEASPAGFGMKSARQGGRAGADAMGRAALGTVALAPLAYWAAMGKITGDAPQDPAKRAAFYESGKRPNSIQIGDKWINYQSIQPLNVPLATVANGFSAWQDAKNDPDATADQVVKDLALGTAGSLLDQSFLSGLSGLVDALGDPKRYGARFVQQIATGFIPFSGALRTVTQSTDPIVRNPQSIAQGVQALIPGQSQKLEPQLTRFGEPVQRGADAFNIFRPSPAVKDSVADALAAADVNLRPAAGRKEVAIGRGQSVPLTQHERTLLGQASGRAVRQLLEQVIASPGYQQAPPPRQQQMLKHAIADARGSVNEQIRRELMGRMAGGQK